MNSRIQDKIRNICEQRKNWIKYADMPKWHFILLLLLCVPAEVALHEIFLSFEAGVRHHIYIYSSSLKFKPSRTQFTAVVSEKVASCQKKNTVDRANSEMENVIIIRGNSQATKTQWKWTCDSTFAKQEHGKTTQTRNVRNWAQFSLMVFFNEPISIVINKCK